MPVICVLSDRWLKTVTPNKSHREVLMYPGFVASPPYTCTLSVGPLERSLNHDGRCDERTSIRDTSFGGDSRVVDYDR